MTKSELQGIKYEFSSYVANINSSHHSNYYSNIKRFISYIQNNSFLMQYIRSFPQTGEDMNTIIPQILSSNGTYAYNFGDTDEKILVNTYNFLSSPLINQTNILEICLMFTLVGEYDKMKDLFYKRVIGPFVSILLKHIDMTLISIGEDVPTPNIITVYGGQLNYAQGHSTISAVQNNNSIDYDKIQRMIEGILLAAKESTASEDDINNLEQALNCISNEIHNSNPNKSLISVLLHGVKDAAIVMGAVPTVVQNINLFAEYIAAFFV
jgi:hypothetical protein